MTKLSFEIAYDNVERAGERQWPANIALAMFLTYPSVYYNSYYTIVKRDGFGYFGRCEADGPQSVKLVADTL